jgi:hypothetical protein
MRFREWQSKHFCLLSDLFIEFRHFVPSLSVHLFDSFCFLLFSKTTDTNVICVDPIEKKISQKMYLDYVREKKKES